MGGILNDGHIKGLLGEVCLQQRLDSDALAFSPCVYDLSPRIVRFNARTCLTIVPPRSRARKIMAGRFKGCYARWKGEHNIRCKEYHTFSSSRGETTFRTKFRSSVAALSSPFMVACLPMIDLKLKTNSKGFSNGADGVSCSWTCLPSTPATLNILKYGYKASS